MSNVTTALEKSPRNALLARLHIARKDAGLEEETYRDLLEREFQTRSASELSDGQIERAISLIAPRKRADHSNVHARKLQALWLSAWNLGVARSRGDDAMHAFLKRQTGLDHSRFLVSAADAAKAIEALKSWLARDAGVQWGLHPRNPVRAVVEAQWARLVAIGTATPRGFEGYALKVTGRPLAACEHVDWLRLSSALGRKVRYELHHRAREDGEK